MVAINENLLAKCADDGCRGDIGIALGNRYHCGNTLHRAPATHTRGARGNTGAYGNTLILTGPLAMLGTATIENAGANPNFGVIVKGKLSWVQVGQWYSAPLTVPNVTDDQFSKLGWVNGIQPLPGANWLAT